MRSLIDFALVPIVRVWASSKRQEIAAFPHADGAPHAHAEGLDSDRILLVGAGPALGWGVMSHDLALPGQLARAISLATGRGADVDLVADPAMTVRSAADVVEPLALWKYDVIIVVLGINDALDLVSPSDWRRDLKTLILALRAGASRTTRVVIVGVQPVRSTPVFDSVLGSLIDLRARQFNAVSAEVAPANPRTTFVALPAELAAANDRQRDAAAYARWARVISEPLVALMLADHGGSDRAAGPTPGFLAESERQRAVDELAALGVGSGDRFDQLVQLAKRLFGTESAAFTIIDGDQQVTKAGVGPGEAVLPRRSSFCAVTIQNRNGMVLADTLDDERFAASPLVTGPPHTRFYAGYPVESPSGQPIGALCVYDPQPRRREDVDMRLLRKLALLLQDEVQRSYSE